MSRLTKNKEKHGRHGELFLVDEETAARTRPLSFDEIMHRRRNKDSSIIPEKENKEEKTLGHGTFDKASDHNEFERNHYRPQKISSHRAPKLRSEVFVVAGSRNTEESCYGEDRPNRHKRGDNSSKTNFRAERDGHTSQTKLSTETKSDALEDRTRPERDGRASQIPLKIERAGHASERKTTERKEARVSQARTRNENEIYTSQAKKSSRVNKVIRRNALKKIDEQLHSKPEIPELTSNVLADESDRSRLRSLIIVMDGTKDQSTNKSGKESEKKYQNGDDQRNRHKNTSKKNDLEKMHAIGISKREEKKERPKLHSSDMREKRRRSRSRDHIQDRNRTRSLSPRVHKAANNRAQHVDLSQDRSARHHTDHDRNKNSNNDSRSHAKRRNESRNGLGGYSPRKRRVEASAKTSSPPSCPPEKMSAMRDIASNLTDNLISQSALPLLQPAAQTPSTNFREAALAIPNPLSVVSFWSPPPKQNASIDSVQLTESTRPMRRLYVENVPDSVSDKSLMESLNDFLLKSGSSHIQGSKPCISCILYKEKGQALVEFLTPEDASSALSFDGCSVSGSFLKIRRPKDFVEVATGELEKKEAAGEALSNIVKDSSEKIFIGGIPKDISPEMLLEIVGVFGTLRAFRYVINEEVEEPCVFLEYTDQSVTFKACAGLNGMKLGGNVITAVQAFPDASISANNDKPPYYGIPERAKPLLGKPSLVLELRNVFNPDGLSSLSEPEVEEILEDVRLECARFGSVKSFNLTKDLSSYMTATSDSCAARNPKIACCDETMSQADTVVSNRASEETEVSEVDRNNKEIEEADPVMGFKDRVHECLDDRISGKDINVSIFSGLKPDEITEDISIENQTAKTESNSNGIMGNSQEDIARAGDDDVTRQQGCAVENVGIEEQKPNTDHVFEPGCIFVEYRRIESSCMAAHSLHGRLFDNRIVTVEYVPIDLYNTRFSK